MAAARRRNASSAVMYVLENGRVASSILLMLHSSLGKSVPDHVVRGVKVCLFDDHGGSIKRFAPPQIVFVSYFPFGELW